MIKSTILKVKSNFTATQDRFISEILKNMSFLEKSSFFQLLYRSRGSRGASQRVQNPPRSLKTIKYIDFSKFSEKWMKKLISPHEHGWFFTRNRTIRKKSEKIPENSKKERKKPLKIYVSISTNCKGASDPKSHKTWPAMYLRQAPMSILAVVQSY